MKRTTTLVLALLAVFVTHTAYSQKGNEEQLLKEANAYFQSGEYLKAFPLYSQLVSLYPNHPDYNYKFGACAIYSEQDKSKAVKYLTIATTKGVEDKMAWYYLGKAHHLNYQFKEAIRAYENFMRNADPKLSAKTDAQREIETCIYGSNLLSNIKDITVISKTEADKVNFFRYFNLESIGGKILTIPDELKSKLDSKSKDPGVIHYPGNSNIIYFSSYGRDGSTGKDIYKAQILPDGKFTSPQKLEGDINTRYDEDYCFLHSDGVTLYFSSKGHNSMGGYDIFKSVFDPSTQTFGQAINLDFAINTPDDDIFYIADSLNQKAYFASGRASDLNHLNVYNVLVEATPLQIVYLKGDFVSEINPDQKKVNMKILDAGSKRVVCETVSGNNNGNYLVYVPKSGDYLFKVTTENSPVVHEVNVTIPPFKQPVALRQEMRLISANGKDKLIINNFFEKPLDEDLSSLAAEMLRKKSNLDVNTSVDVAKSLPNTKPSINGGELTTFDKSMANAPIAGGFANGVTIASVTDDMKKESAKVNQFVVESSVKYDNSLAYAVKKQKEAESVLVEAENIRQKLGIITSDEDVKQLRKSVELADKAQQLQREAKAALNASESIQQYKTSEKERAAHLDAQVSALQVAETTGKYEEVVSILTEERNRQTALRDGTGSTPVNEINAKVKARESELSRSEQKLNDMRLTEMDLAGQTKAAQEKLNNAQKDKDKQLASNELADVKSSLDEVRRLIVQQSAKVAKDGNEVKMAQANAAYFSSVSTNSSYGLEEKEKIKLSDIDKTMLTMKLDEMKNRVNALEIVDPQMRALITEGATDAIVASNNGIAKTDTQASSIPVNTSSQTNPVVTNKTETPVEKSNVPDNSAALKPDTKSSVASTTPSVENNKVQPFITDTPLPNTTAVSNGGSSTPGVSASNIRSQKDALLAKAGSQPGLAPARRMILIQSMDDAKSAMLTLEAKKKAGTFSDADNMQLSELSKLRTELKNAIVSNGSTPGGLTPDEVRAVYASISPDYNARTAQITNTKGSEIDRTVMMIDYKAATLEQLKAARIANAKVASKLTDTVKIAELATNDQKYEVAINTLTNETHDVNQYKSAYETENKAIIESDAIFATKLQNQIAVTENYVEALAAMRAGKQEEFDRAVDNEERNALAMQLKDVKSEEQIAFTKLELYRHDLQLTTSAADPKATASKENESGEEFTEDTDATDIAAAEESMKKEDAFEKVTLDAVKIEKMFKRREQGESIFAYESGSFEEIIAHQQGPSLQLKNREELRSINDEIFLLEAEMENVENISKLRRLDYKAEQLYQRRSIIEIDNAPNIAKMTRREYDEELAKANEETGENAEKIESKIMFREELKRLKRDADVHMRNAQEIREKAPAIQDDIERADYYRQAFAKEALAIDNLRQIQSICENIDMISTYSDQDLVMLRAGKVPFDRLPPATVKEEPVKETARAVEAYVPEAEKPVIVDAVIASEQEVVAEVKPAPVDEKSVVVEMTPDTQKANTQNQVLNFSTTNSGEIVTDKKTVVANEAGNINMTLAVNEPKNTAEVKSEPVKLDTANSPEVVVVKPEIKAAVVKPNEVTNDANNASEAPKEVSKSGASTTAESTLVNKNETTATHNAATKTNEPSSSVTSNTTTKTSVAASEKPASVSNAASTNAPAEAIANATAKGTASGNAEDYYFAMPEVLVADLFKRTSRAVYSENRPIPMDMEMPNGIYYKVQIGAFRNDIPQNLYDEFAPICGESLANGIKRYTAGFFLKLEGADQIKREIRDIGYSDAFVVAYRDGKRIPLYEAIDKTDSADFVAAIEKEYIYGDKGEAPKTVGSASKSSNAVNQGSAKEEENVNHGKVNETPSKSLVTDYYKGDVSTVKATQVEAVQGLFYTVQVGVYSKPVAAKNMHNIKNLNSELTESKKIRYTSGRYPSMMAAVEKRAEARSLGINDAFMTAYYNGRRISLSEADELLKVKGPGILAK